MTADPDNWGGYYKSVKLTLCGLSPHKEILVFVSSKACAENVGIFTHPLSSYIPTLVWCLSVPSVDTTFQEARLSLDVASNGMMAKVF